MFLAYAIIFCLAFTAAVLSAPVVRFVAVRIGAMDLPDGKRKIHAKPTPRLGGVVITVAIFLAVGVFALMTPDVTQLIFKSTRRLSGFIAGLAIILGLGIYDDIKGVRPRTKLFWQTLAVVACYAGGYRVEMPWLTGSSFSFLAFPITWFWLVACINAMNLVDGMDGLASGVTFFAGAVIFVLAAVYVKVSVAILAAAMLGSVVGFLMYNFHPAVMFLGDSGSLLLGYLIAILAITGSLKSHATVALLIPILALGLPIMDTLLAILRRWSRHIPVSQADREHIHHKLLALGLSHREAVIVLYASCLALATAALAVASASSYIVGFLLGTLCIGGVAAVHFIGAGELAAFFRRIGESMRAPGGERFHAAVKKSSFWLRHARTCDELVRALEPFLVELPASAALIKDSEGIVELARINVAPTGRRGRLREALSFPSGENIFLVLEGVQKRTALLPSEIRRALNVALAGIEGGNRGLDVAVKPAEGFSTSAPAG